MTVKYENGVLTFTPDDTERPVLDYIFSRVDGEPLTLFHMNSLISQRRAQFESDTKDQLFVALQKGDIKMPVITPEPITPVPPVAATEG